ncbi:hypothetical protein [Alkalihalobacillus pseudalcaliphilus]|uniref:hypothetical protein n=1 Tax=Alkalihalobacillus pseudalcaliphilus TaxID=79884 RepID=UPI00064DED80|nr:hypothetical protein [Alkalihalobacillus pseudalcaliphilus]KMK74344.1 hypothetical protein AB990_20725 [Alkalihalobacillus pseudalcaliphilus]
MTEPRTIPIFDCDYHLFDQHIEFYTALGFQMTYYQKSPYRFASVEKAGIGEFSFYGAKNYETEGNIGGCYVAVPNVKEIYEELKANLKAYYGKIPAKGTPRISRLNRTTEDWRVNITDFSGNSIIIGTSLGDSTDLMKTEDIRVKELDSKFEKLYTQAYRFAFSKEDFLAARNTLEVAFKKHQHHAPQQLLIKATVLQMEVFINLDQQEFAKRAVQRINKLNLSDKEKLALDETFQRLNELQEELH